MSSAQCISQAWAQPPDVCTTILTQPCRSVCMHRPPLVQAHSLCAHPRTYSECALTYPLGDPWRGAGTDRGPPALVAWEGLRVKQGGRGREESKEGGGGGVVASASGSGRLTRTNPLIDSLPVHP